MPFSTRSRNLEHRWVHNALSASIAPCDPPDSVKEEL